MDSSVSFLHYELAATIEQAVRHAVDTVLREAARVVGARLSAARSAAAESHRENRSLRERLDMSQSELKAVRFYMCAAEKNIQQCLMLQRTQGAPARPRPHAEGAARAGGTADPDFTLSSRLDADPCRTHTHQEGDSQALESDVGKFEFEMGVPAGGVNDLALIRVLEDGEEVREASVKIEKDAEEPIAVESPPTGGAVEGVGVAPATSGRGPGDSAEKVHRCGVCGRGFRRFYCLKTHQRIHTGERPYPCRFCDKRFRHLDSLHKHQRIHTGERPYRCHQCACCFRELGQLKKHRLTHGTQQAGPNPLTLLPTGASFTWSHLTQQPLDSA